MTKNDFVDLPARINEVRESFESNWDQLSIASVDDTVSSVVTGHFNVVFYSDESVPDNGQRVRVSRPRVTVVVVCAVVIFSVLFTLTIVLVRVVLSRSQLETMYGRKGSRLFCVVYLLAEITIRFIKSNTI